MLLNGFNKYALSRRDVIFIEMNLSKGNILNDDPKFRTIPPDITIKENGPHTFSQKEPKKKFNHSPGLMTQGSLH